MKRAVIDIGTNSVLLLIGEMNNGQIGDVMQAFNVTRLGEGLQKTGRISTEAADRTLQVIRSYRSLIEKRNVSSVHLVGTEALRKAVNSDEFIKRVQKEFGWVCTVLSGDDEAQFGYKGTIRELVRPDQNAVVIDVGGGSTEIVCGQGDDITFFDSIPVGVVKIAEMYDGPIRISESTRVQILNDLKSAFRDVACPDNSILIGSGGTITTLVAIKEKMSSYDPEQINGYRLGIGELAEMYDHLNAMTASQRLSLPGLLPGREDVILFGILIFMAIMKKCGFEHIQASDRGLRFGYFYHIETIMSKN